MKHFLVLYILIILGIIPAQSQELTAEKIVSSSFLKFTNGKIPDSYGLKTEFLELKKIPAEKIVVPPVLARLASNYQDKCESTTFQVATQKGLLHEFEQEEIDNPIQILLFNPNEIRPYFSLRVGYYLKDKEIFYLDGAVNEKRDLQATPIEKLLWDFIGSQNLKVKKIVFSNSYTDNQPATMSFEELQTRINRSSSIKSSDN